MYIQGKFLPFHESSSVVLQGKNMLRVKVTESTTPVVYQELKNKIKLANLNVWNDAQPGSYIK